MLPSMINCHGASVRVQGLAPALPPPTHRSWPPGHSATAACFPAARSASSLPAYHRCHRHRRYRTRLFWSKFLLVTTGIWWGVGMQLIYYQGAGHPLAQLPNAVRA